MCLINIFKLSKDDDRDLINKKCSHNLSSRCGTKFSFNAFSPEDENIPEIDEELSDLGDKAIEPENYLSIYGFDHIDELNLYDITKLMAVLGSNKIDFIGFDLFKTDKNIAFMFYGYYQESIIHLMLILRDAASPLLREKVVNLVDMENEFINKYPGYINNKNNYSGSMVETIKSDLNAIKIERETLSIAYAIMRINMARVILKRNKFESLFKMIKRIISYSRFMFKLYSPMSNRNSIELLLTEEEVIQHEYTKAK